MSAATGTVADSVIAAAAARLAEAAASGVPCAPIRDLIEASDIDSAYRIQQQLNSRRIAAGARVIGRKIGLTSRAVQQQIGVDQPDFGVLFDDMSYPDGAEIGPGAVLQPKAEAEIAFVLGADLVEGELAVAQVRGAIEYAVAALEICGSRVANWDIRFADTVADNASSGVFVLGTEHKSLAEFEPVTAQMRMLLDGVEVSTGTGAACLGDPLNAVVWLARTARAYGAPLREGQVILSGALGPMQAMSPGHEVTAAITGLGSVSARFTTGDAL